MAKREYLEAMRQRYQKLQSRSEKTQMLDEICATTGYDRKYVTKRLRASFKSPGGSKKRRGRAKVYFGQELLKPLRKIWRTAHYPCSKRLRPMLPVWVDRYEQSFGLLAIEVRRKLLNMSPSTIDRLLKPVRLEHPKGRSTTKPGGLLREQIPIQTGQWQEYRPGFVEADTVAHCGGNMAGEFVYTLDCVDIATGWSEQRAVWNKRAKAVVRQMSSIEKALPFPLLGFDADNGSEFINLLLFKHFAKRQRPVQFTRSRAYHKNDNAHVEQKNWTHVREWIGYERIENPKAVNLLNSLYANEWRLFHNFYCASLKLISKQRVGSKIIKRHDTAKTPYQRVIESPHVSDFHKRGLKEIFDNTNPFTLRRIIDNKLRKIFKLCYN